jgi:hypothetical protein
LAKWIKKGDPTMCCLQEIYLIDRKKDWLMLKGWKKIYQANAPPQKGRCSNTDTRKSRLQTCIGQMKQRRTLHTNKMDNASKGNNNFQLICTQCQCSQFYQTYSKGLKSTYRLQTVVMGDFNVPLSTIDRSSKPKNQQRNPKNK